MTEAVAHPPTSDEVEEVAEQLEDEVEEIAPTLDREATETQAGTTLVRKALADPTSRAEGIADLSNIFADLSSMYPGSE